MTIWLAAGDETGDWDMVDHDFPDEELGLALVIGDLSTWNSALQQSLGNACALDAFATPLPEQVSQPRRPFRQPSTKYHVRDVWQVTSRPASGLDLEQPYGNPVKELLRQHARWLLYDSGLGVLTVHGSRGSLHRAGLGASQDGLRERAKAFAALFSPVLPFLPSDASLNLLLEGRTESALADATRHNRATPAGSGGRTLEPYRDFIAAVYEHLQHSAQSQESMVADGHLASRFYIGGKARLQPFLENQARGVPFLQANAERVVLAMNGLADLATALIPRQQPIIVVPPDCRGSVWSVEFTELRDAFKR